MLACRRSNQSASTYDDMVRKRRHRHRNEHLTNVNICWRAAVLGGSTNTNSENQRLQDLPVVPRGPLLVCSLDGATFIDLKLAQVQAKFRNLDDRARAGRHTPLKGGAGRLILDVAHAGPPIQKQIVFGICCDEGDRRHRNKNAPWSRE